MAPTLMLVIGRILLAVMAVLLGLAILLWVFQRALIYHPRSYNEPSPGLLLATHLERGRAAILQFDLDGWRQYAYYLSSAQEATSQAKQLWIFFGGNASLALDWLDVAETLLPCTFGILLIEYPGYGANEGKPSREAIVRVSKLAFARLAEHLRKSPEDLARNTSVLGVSLGCAAALEFARELRVGQLVLLAPFTSLLDMARRTVGWPLCYLTRDRFDNLKALRELSCARPDVVVHLFHGDHDGVVPVEMGRRLATAFPAIVHYTEIPGADHWNILEVAYPALRAIVCERAPIISAQGSH